MIPESSSVAAKPVTESLSMSDGDLAELGPILAGLSGEIRRPLEGLRAGIERLLTDPSQPITEAERVQARSMLGLCESLDRLTRECLEGAGPCTDG